jgi:hypothetical protein
MSRVGRADDVGEIPGLVERFDVSREAQDAYGARSQQRACEATRSEPAGHACR